MGTADPGRGTLGSEADFANDMSWLSDDGGYSTPVVPREPATSPATEDPTHQDRGVFIITLARYRAAVSNP